MEGGRHLRRQGPRAQPAFSRWLTRASSCVFTLSREYCESPGFATWPRVAVPWDPVGPQGTPWDPVGPHGTSWDLTQDNGMWRRTCWRIWDALLGSSGEGRERSAPAGASLAVRQRWRRRAECKGGGWAGSKQCMHDWGGDALTARVRGSSSLTKHTAHQTHRRHHTG